MDTGFERCFACFFLYFQVGVAELKIAVERTGGIVVLAESFGHAVFRDSLKRVFQSTDYDLGLSSKLVFLVLMSGFKLCWLNDILVIFV